MSPLNLDDFTDLIERPDGGVRRDAEARRERQVVPPGALGRLDELGEWLAAAQSSVPVRPIERPRVVLFAGDHGIAELGVSARPAGTAGRLVREVLEGARPVSVLARRLGVPVRVVDMALDCDPATLPAEVAGHRVRRGSGRIDLEDALTAEEAEAAFRAGAAVADEEADSGTDLVVLGDVSVGGTTAAGVLVAALCGTDASVVTGRGGLAIDDLAWMRKCAAIRDALRRARPVLGDQLQLLATVGGADLTAITGFLLQSAVRKLPVILDGVVVAACALVAQRIAFRAPDWWLAGQNSGEPGQAKALDRMALEPLLDHGVTVGEGAGALLALPLVQAAAALAAELPELPEQTEQTEQGTTADGEPAETGSGEPRSTEEETGAPREARSAEQEVGASSQPQPVDQASPEPQPTGHEAETYPELRSTGHEADASPEPVSAADRPADESVGSAPAERPGTSEEPGAPAQAGTSGQVREAGRAGESGVRAEPDAFAELREFARAAEAGETGDSGTPAEPKE